jgi:Na+-transporting methylmalonyl-CoA/oxaloacetate decarboxylase beta subunit
VRPFGKRDIYKIVDGIITYEFIGEEERRLKKKNRKKRINQIFKLLFPKITHILIQLKSPVLLGFSAFSALRGSLQLLKCIPSDQMSRM